MFFFPHSSHEKQSRSQEYIKNSLSQPLNLEKVEAHVKTHVMESDTSHLFAFTLRSRENAKI